MFALLLSIFVDSIGWGVVYPVFDALVINNVTGMMPMGMSLLERNMCFELLIGVYCVAMFLSAPLLGSLSDKYGRKWLLIIALIGAGIGPLFYAWGAAVGSVALLFVGRILAGATAGNLAISQAAIADLSTPETFPRNLGFIGVANGVGFAAGPMIGAVLLNKHLFSHVSYMAPFFVTAGVIFMAVLFLLFFFKDRYKGNRELIISLATTFVNMRDAFTWPRVRRLFWVFFIFFSAYTLFFNNLPIFLETRFHLGGAGTGNVITGFSVLFTFALLVALPWLTKKYPLKSIVVVSLFVQLVSIALFMMAFKMSMVWALIAPIAFTVPFIYIGIVSMVSNETSPKSQGKMMGVVASVVALCFGVGPVLAGYLMRGGIPLVYGVAELFLVASVALALKF